MVKYHRGAIPFKRRLVLITSDAEESREGGAVANVIPYCAALRESSAFKSAKSLESETRWKSGKSELWDVVGGGSES